VASVQEEGQVPTAFFSVLPREMSAPQLEKSESPKPERASLLRFIVWGVLFIALIAGIVLFFKFGRNMSSLL
jgi:hypothetical protein